MKTISIKCHSNTYIGRKKNKDVNAFYGVRYAEKLTNLTKFKRSVINTEQNKTFDCTKVSSCFYQFTPNYDGDIVPRQKLNSLTLDIYTNNSKELKPVLVWIHGGGFNSGCGSFPMYQGDSFAKNDIVFVSINYRLGFYGFLDMSSLGCDFDSNVGFSDMITALKWIKENISSFGGDPSSVTIDGESAGGVSTLALLASPMTTGLFSKVISQSCLAYGVQEEKVNNLYKEAFLKALRINKNNANKLFTIKDRKLITTYASVYSRIKKKYIGIDGNSIVKDDLLPLGIVEGIKTYNKNIPLLLGSNKDEGTLFASPYMGDAFPYSWKLVKSFLSRNGNSLIYEDLKKYYIDNYNENPFYQLATDYMFNYGIDKVASINPSSTYVYRFDYYTSKTMNQGYYACHSLEMSLALGNTSSTMLHRENFFEGEKKKIVSIIERKLNDDWINFVKYGYPKSDYKTYDKNKYVHIYNIKEDETSYSSYYPFTLFDKVDMNNNH